ncbi:GNAT family N-acetyltransferase [Candidatus Dojkabacteria bacterium]|nr:GNAT family N-acetyltransferase [Candidatus Dojkabacteria bacterium]
MDTKNELESPQQTEVGLTFYQVLPSGIDSVRGACFGRVVALPESNEGVLVGLLQGSNPEAISFRQMENLASLYAETFAAPPWNEVGRCFQCGNFFSEKGNSCPNDGNIIEQAYPLGWTTSYIGKELGRQNSYFVLFQTQEGKFISFGWGYQISLRELTQEKYSQEERTQKNFLELLSRRLRSSQDSPVFYISEIGTAPGWRGKGLATEILKLLLDRSMFLGLKAVTRTIIDPPSIYGVAQKIGMTQISGPLRGTEQVIEPVDGINPKRTLFVNLLS